MKSCSSSFLDISHSHNMWTAPDLENREGRKTVESENNISFSVSGQKVYLTDANLISEYIELESVQLVVTSPPYWNVKDYGDPAQIGFGQSYRTFVKSLDSVWEKCVRVLKPNGKIAVIIQPIPVSSKQTGLGRSSILNIMTDVQSTMKKLGLDLSNIFIWYKRKYNNQRIFGS